MSNGNPHHSIPGLEMPQLEHPQLLSYFRSGFGISDEELKLPLGLPRESLVADLVAILEFGKQHHGDFREAGRGGLVERTDLNFVIHACLLLAELEASEVLPLVLEVTGNTDYGDLYIGDEFDHGFWQVYYRLGRKNPETLVEFVGGKFEDEAQCCVVEALGQLAMHEPVWRDRVIAWLSDLLQSLIKRKGEYENLVLSQVVLALRDLRAVSALPLIEEATSKHLTLPFVCGSLEEIKKHIADGSQQFTKQELLGIEEIYRNFHQLEEEVEMMNSGNFDFGLSAKLDLPVSKPITPKKPKNMPAVTIRPKSESEFGKVGRNDPCPCGSGKKYKKCHGG